jgi:hypothetical protein
MMKFVIGIAFIIIVLAGGWYLLSPAFIVEERNDPFPTSGKAPMDEPPLVIEDASPEQVVFTPPINDAFESMPPGVRKAFEEAVEEIKDEVIEMTDRMPSQPQVVAQGLFMPRAHEVAGTALLVKHDGAKTLRFENFETINGPKLHIYLASDLSADDYVDLGEIKATKGNVNYELDSSIDTNKYNHVLVWCVPFRVLFSYAQLQ